MNRELRASGIDPASLSGIFDLAPELAAIVDGSGRVLAASAHWSPPEGVTELADLVLDADRDAARDAADTLGDGGEIRWSARARAGAAPTAWCARPLGGDLHAVAGRTSEPDAWTARTALERVSIGLALIDVEGRYRYVNAAYCAIYGFAATELVGTPFTQVFDPAERDGAWAFHNAVLRGEHQHEPRELRVRRRDGSPMRIDTRSCRIDLPGGGALRFANVIDVTETRAREQRLADAEARLRDLHSRIPGAVYQLVRHPDGRYETTHVSEGFREIAGLDKPVEELDFDTIVSLMPADEARQAVELAEASARDLSPYARVSPLDTPAGRRWIDARSQPHRLDDGRVVWNGVMIDVTERKRAEARLADAEAELRSLTNAIPGAIYRFRCDADGTYVLDFISEGFRRLTGIAADAELDFQTVFALVPDGHREELAASIDAAVRDGAPWQEEFPLDAPAGRIWVYGSSQPQRRADGQRVWNGLLIDITDRKQAEARLAEAEALQRGINSSLPGAVFQLVREPGGAHRFRYMSEGLRDLAGFGDEFPVADFDACRELIDARDREAVLAALEQAEQGLEPLRQEFRLAAPRGTLWVELRAVPGARADGTVVSNGLITDVTDRHEAQAAAERLGTILESTPDLVAITDTDGTITYINAGGLQLLGATDAAQVQGAPLARFMAAGDDAALASVAFPAAHESGSWQGEARLATVDGALVPVSQTVLCHRDASGAVTHYSTIVRDLTERVEAERAIARRERHFRELYNRTPVMLHEIDPEGRITAVSDHWLETLGYSRDEVIGRPSLDFFTEASRERARKQARPRFWREGRVSNEPLQVVCRDGTTLDVLLSADSDRDDAGNVVRGRSVMVDVTEQRRAEAGYREIFDNATEGIYRTTPDGHVLRANPALVRLHGFDSEEAMLSAVTDIAGQWYVDARDRELVTDLLERHGRVENFEAQVYRVATGERIWTSENARVVYDHDGRPAYYEGTVREITGQRRARQLAARRGELLEMVARDRPLTDILYELVGTVEQVFDRITAAIFHIEDGRLATAAAPGLGNACITALEGCAPEAAGGAITDALQRDRSSVDTRLADTDRPFVQAARECGYGAVIAVPVRDQRGVALGVLIGCVAHAGEAEQESLELLSEVAQITSIAIEQHRLSQELLQRAQYDMLTGLPNRALLADRLDIALREALRGSHPVAVLLLDLDEFKLVNDTMGHSAGDELLVNVAERLAGCLRAGDTVARLGGDEFVVVVPLRDHAEATDVAERILEQLQESVTVAGREVAAHPSIGISLYPSDGEDAEALLQAADTAMYAAKHAGKNRFRYFAEEMNETMTARLRIEAELRQALADEQLTLHYQPRVAVPGGEIVGAEGLLRWQHPERGLLPPGEFLSVAERGPLIAAIDRRVLRAAARQAASWQAAGHALVVAANLSTRELHADGFAAEVAQALEETGVDPAGLELEITESMLLHDFERASRQLRELKERAPGLRVAIDDFGSGYSSLNYLRRLPIDTLKIDRAFVADLLGDDGGTAEAIVRTIVELGRNLGLTVVGEGVEEAAQAQRLARLGCDQAQGFWFAAALAPEELDRRLAR